MAVIDPRLQNQVAVVPRSPSVQTLEDVLKRAGTLRDAAATAGVTYRQFDSAPSGPAAPKKQYPGGWKGILARAVDNPVGRGLIKGIEVATFGSRLAVSSAKELYDLLDPSQDASLSDLWEQAKDPSWGTGTAFKQATSNVMQLSPAFGAFAGYKVNPKLMVNGVELSGYEKNLNKLAGLYGDIVMDPLTYMTLGTHKIGRYGTEQLVQNGAVKTAAAVAASRGGLTISGRRGRLALGQAVLEVTGDEMLAATAARFGRAGLTADVLEKIGLDRAGIYMMGYRVPFTGAVEHLQLGSAKLRAWSGDTFLKRAAGLITPEDSNKALQAIARGQVPPGDFPTYLTIANARPVARAAENGARRRVDDFTKALFGEKKLADALKDIRTIAHRPMEQGTDLDEPLLKRVRAWFAAMRAEIQADMKAVDPSAPDIGEVYNYFPHYRTSEAARWLEKAESQEAQRLRSVLFNPLDDVGSFKERLTIGDWWFGKKLEHPSELTAEALNKAARVRGGVTFDFFETDLVQAMQGYMEMFARQKGVIARRKYLADNGVLSARGMTVQLNADMANGVREALDIAKTERAAASKNAAQTAKKLGETIEKIVGKADDVAESLVDDAERTAALAQQRYDKTAAQIAGDSRMIVLQKQFDDAVAEFERVANMFRSIFGGDVNEVVAAVERQHDELLQEMYGLQQKLLRADASATEIAEEMRVLQEALGEAAARENHLIKHGNELQAHLDSIIKGERVTIDGELMTDIGQAFGKTDLMNKGQLEAALSSQAVPSDDSLWNQALQEAEAEFASYKTKSGGTQGKAMQVKRRALQIYRDSGGTFSDPGNLTQRDWWVGSNTFDPIKPKEVWSLSREDVMDILARSFSDDASIRELRVALLWIGAQFDQSRPAWWGRVFGGDGTQSLMASADAMSALFSRMKMKDGFAELVRVRDNFAQIENKMVETVERYTNIRVMRDALTELYNEERNLTEGSARAIEQALGSDSWVFSDLHPILDAAGMLDDNKTITDVLEWLNDELFRIADGEAEEFFATVDGVTSTLKQFKDGKPIKFAEMRPLDFGIVELDQIDWRAITPFDARNMVRLKLGKNAINQGSDGVWRTLGGEARSATGAGREATQAVGGVKRATVVRGAPTKGGRTMLPYYKLAKDEFSETGELLRAGDPDAKSLVRVEEEIQALDVRMRREQEWLNALNKGGFSNADVVQLDGQTFRAGDLRKALATSGPQNQEQMTKLLKEQQSLSEKLSTVNLAPESIAARQAQINAELQKGAPGIWDRSMNVLQNVAGDGRSRKTTLLAEAQREVRQPIADALQKAWFVSEVDARYRAAAAALEAHGVEPTPRLLVRVVNEVARSQSVPVREIGDALADARSAIGSILDQVDLDSSYASWVGKEADLYATIQKGLADADANGSIRKALAAVGGDADSVTLLSRWRNVGGVKGNSGDPKRVRNIKSALNKAYRSGDNTAVARLTAELEQYDLQAVARVEQREAMKKELQEWYKRTYPTATGKKTSLETIDTALRERAAASNLRGIGTLSESSSAQQMIKWLRAVRDRLDGALEQHGSSSRWLLNASDPFLQNMPEDELLAALDNGLLSTTVSTIAASMRADARALVEIRSKRFKVVEELDKAERAFEYANDTGTKLTTIDRLNLVLDALTDDKRLYDMSEFPWLQPGSQDYENLSRLFQLKKQVWESKQNPLYLVGLREETAMQVRRLLAGYTVRGDGSLGYAVPPHERVREMLVAWSKETEAAARESAPDRVRQKIALAEEKVLEAQGKFGELPLVLAPNTIDAQYADVVASVADLAKAQRATASKELKPSSAEPYIYELVRVQRRRKYDGKVIDYEILMRVKDPSKVDPSAKYFIIGDGRPGEEVGQLVDSLNAAADARIAAESAEAGEVAFNDFSRLREEILGRGEVLSRVEPSYRPLVDADGSRVVLTGAEIDSLFFDLPLLRELEGRGASLGPNPTEGEFIVQALRSAKDFPYEKRLKQNLANQEEILRLMAVADGDTQRLASLRVSYERVSEAITNDLAALQEFGDNLSTQVMSDVVALQRRTEMYFEELATARYRPSNLDPRAQAQRRTMLQQLEAEIAQLRTSIASNLPSVSKQMAAVRRSAQQKLDKIVTTLMSDGGPTVDMVEKWLVTRRSRSEWVVSGARAYRMEALKKFRKPSTLYLNEARKLERELYNEITRLTNIERARNFNEVAHLRKVEARIADLQRIGRARAVKSGIVARKMAERAGEISQVAFDPNYVPSQWQITLPFNINPNRPTPTAAAGLVVEKGKVEGLSSVVTAAKKDSGALPDWLKISPNGEMRIDAMKRLIAITKEIEANGGTVADAARQLWDELDQMRSIDYNQILRPNLENVRVNTNGVARTTSETASAINPAGAFGFIEDTRDQIERAIDALQEQIVEVQGRLFALGVEGHASPWSALSGTPAAYRLNPFNMADRVGDLLGRQVRAAEERVLDAAQALRRAQPYFDAKANVLEAYRNRVAGLNTLAEETRAALTAQHDGMKQLVEIAEDAAKRKVAGSEEHMAVLLDALDQNEQLLREAETVWQREIDRIESMPNWNKKGSPTKARHAELKKLQEQHRLMWQLRADLAQSWNAVQLKDAEMIGLHKQLEAGIADGSFLDYVVNEVKDGWVALDAIGMPGFEARKDIAEMITNVSRVVDPNMKSAVGRFIRSFTNFFRAYALAMPGVAVRNTLSNTFALLAAGTEAESFANGIGLFREIRQKVSAGQFERWVEKLPAERKAFVESVLELVDASGAGQTGDAFRTFQGRKWLVDNAYVRTFRKMNSYAEEAARFVLAYDSVTKGMDLQTGYARISRFLFDYSDVSALDQRMRQIVPFWFWMSRNLPLQVMNQWSNPRWYAIYNNTRRNFEQERPDTPQWMREAGFFEIGRNLVFASFAPQDASAQLLTEALTDPARLAADVNPIIRVPFETLGNRKLYNNQGFRDVREDPFGGFVGNAILTLARQTDGNGQVSPRANYWVKNVLPPVAQFERLFGDAYNDRRPASWLSYFGVPVRPVSDTQREQEMKRQQDELKRMLASQNK